MRDFHFSKQNSISDRLPCVYRDELFARKHSLRSEKNRANVMTDLKAPSTKWSGSGGGGGRLECLCERLLLAGRKREKEKEKEKEKERQIDR